MSVNSGHNSEGREVAQLLGACTDLPEEPSSHPCMHIKRLITVKGPECEQHWPGIVQDSHCANDSDPCEGPENANLGQL